MAAACPNDCDINGLNVAASRGQIKKLVLYVSKGDEILGLGPLVSYGSLGKDGPVKMSAALGAVTTIVSSPSPGCRHNDWVVRDFEQSMRAVTGGG